MKKQRLEDEAWIRPGERTGAEHPVTAVLMERLGVGRVYMDRMSGKDTHRPQLGKRMEFVRKGTRWRRCPSAALQKYTGPAKRQVFFYAKFGTPWRNRDTSMRQDYRLH